MKTEEVAQLVTGLSVGSILHLTYKADAARAAFYLVGMADNGFIEFVYPGHELVAYDAGESGSWGNADRVLVIRVKDGFEKKLDWFLDRVAWHLESLEVVPVASGTSSKVT